MRAILLLAVLVLAITNENVLVAQQSQATSPDVDLSNIPLETKREWVRAAMIREFATGLDAATLKKIDDSVANMPVERIDRLVATYAKRAQSDAQVQSQENRLTQQQDEATRQARIAEYQAKLAASRSGGSPGYAPVITTLPSGASLGASAVVSPDRRYVRMNLQPFFSSVGPVQNFTFQNPYPTGSITPSPNSYPNTYPYYYPYPHTSRRGSRIPLPVQIPYQHIEIVPRKVASP